MSQRVFVEGAPIDLGPQDFVAAGGQGRVYARDDIAFKLFADPALTPPLDKLAALRGLAGPHVAAPDREVHDRAGAVIGYTMPFFRGAHSWAQLSTPAFRARAGIDDAGALGLVRSLGAALSEIHRHGVCVVDLSENNVLVRGSAVCLIDLDSWQTPGHAATAITPTIASPHAPAGRFDAGTDWFAFAVLATSLLLGIHPFKGKHSTVKGMSERMRAGLSVFNASVRVPAMCKDPRSIPVDLAQWLKAVLERGQTSPPPLGPLPSPRPRAATPGGGHVYPQPIRWVLVERDRVIVATRTAAYIDESVWHDDQRPLRALGRARDGTPFILQDGARGLELRVMGADARIPVPIAPDDLLSHDGTVFARCRGRLLALEVRKVGIAAVLLTREVARVLPHATQLFPGVALQNVFGQRRAALLGHAQGTPHVVLGDWGAQEVLDARRAGDRLVVLTQHAGVISRHTVSVEGGTPAREVDVEPWGTQFVQQGDLYVEVGPDGIRRRAGGAPGPWQAIGHDLQAAELHTDGSRLFTTADRVLREVRALRAPTRLGFDASRCR